MLDLLGKLPNMYYVGISANEYIWNIKYFNCGEIDKDKIDHHSWPEFFFRLCLHNCLRCHCITAMVNHVFVRASTSKGRKDLQAPPTKQDLGTTKGFFSKYPKNPALSPPGFWNLLLRPEPSFVRWLGDAQMFPFAAQQITSSSLTRLIY